MASTCEDALFRLPTVSVRVCTIRLDSVESLTPPTDFLGLPMAHEADFSLRVCI
jgi:hypothetical protein